MAIKIFELFVLVVLLSGFISAQPPKFDYVDVSSTKVTTTHAARYRVKVDKPFKLLGEFHHQPTYGGKKFNVSLAVFSDGVRLIMVHAETQADGSGGLDYSKLAPASLNGLKFTSREQCAPPEDETEMAANPEVAFIRGKGFALKPSFYLKQFFATDEKGTAETVISYGQSVASCGGDVITAAFKTGIEQEIAKRIVVTKLP